LFAGPNAAPARLDHAMDDIRRRFGKGLLTRASLLQMPPGKPRSRPE
jgi:hypothetical protein